MLQMLSRNCGARPLYLLLWCNPYCTLPPAVVHLAPPPPFLILPRSEADAGGYPMQALSM